MVSVDDQPEEPFKSVEKQSFAATHVFSVCYRISSSIQLVHLLLPLCLRNLINSACQQVIVVVAPDIPSIDDDDPEIVLVLASGSQERCATFSSFLTTLPVRRIYHSSLVAQHYLTVESIKTLLWTNSYNISVISLISCLIINILLD